MFTGIAIFASVVLWLMVKDKGFRKIVFVGICVGALIGTGAAMWYYGFRLPGEKRKAQDEKAKEENASKNGVEPPSSEHVRVHGPDAKTYDFPAGTTKDSAIAYFKRKGIGVHLEPNKKPEGYVKGDSVLYSDFDLSGHAVGVAETNDVVRIVARNNIYGTLRVKDIHNGFQGWIAEKNVQVVVVEPGPASTKLSPCGSSDPLGLYSANPCQPPSPNSGATPCPASDPAGLYTPQACTPRPSQ